MMNDSVVAVIKTSPETVVLDYARLLDLAEVERFLDREHDTLLKLNLSWTKYFPSCSSHPWQLEGVVRGLLERGYDRHKLIPVENKTADTDPLAGCENNLWDGVLQHYGLSFVPLTHVDWCVHRFESELLRLNEIFPEGIEIPVMYRGKNIVHLPTVQTHGRSTTSGAIKNAFGGLLKETRQYAHEHIHEVLVDLVCMQRELHPGVFAVVDGTVCGDGAGPRTMVPRIEDFIFASGDSVAIDAVAASMMGFNPLEIPYLRMCHERELGCADMQKIKIVGEDVRGVNFGFETKKSFVMRDGQTLRKGPMRFLERLALHSPLFAWAPLASKFYHDLLWYPTVGRKRIKQFDHTEWGRLFDSYRRPPVDRVGTAQATAAPQTVGL